MNGTQQLFLEKLHEEARLQAKLQHTQLLPEQFGWIGSIIGRYPWQFLLITSGITAATLEVWMYLL